MKRTEHSFFLWNGWSVHNPKNLEAIMATVLPPLMQTKPRMAAGCAFTSPPPLVLIRKLGEGRHGTVLAARNSAGTPLAVKISPNSPDVMQEIFAVRVRDAIVCGSNC